MSATIPRPDPVPTCTEPNPCGHGLARCGAEAAVDTRSGPRCEDHLTRGYYEGPVRRYAPAEPAPVEATADVGEPNSAERAAHQAGVEAERARLLRLVREQACEEARIKQEHEARAADLDRQADGERDKAERHDERREALYRLHEMIAKGEG